MISRAELLRELPSVDELLRSPEVASLEAPPAALRDAARSAIDDVRREILSAGEDQAAPSSSKDVTALIAALPKRVREKLQRARRYSLRPVINATGVVLHTNLGRAPLPHAAIEHIASIAGGYSNLEYDIDAGERGKRDVHVERLFARLFAEIRYEEEAATAPVKAIVVNNCAAATILALNTVAQGGEVIVSRGELVEIGGSFRIPEVMQRSGAVLREVGTTNRTRIADYERAITAQTRLLMRVHRSNFAITGFTEQPSLEQLVRLGRKHGIPVFEDQGNGAIVELRALNPAVAGEAPPTVAETLRAGVDLVSFSGDKLLGGPQAGVLAGRPKLIAAARTNPFFRAMRVDKLTYAALEATLAAYAEEDFERVPIARMLRMSADEVRARAERIIEQLQQRCKRGDASEGAGLAAELVAGESVIGGGTAPTVTLPTWLVALTHPNMNADTLARGLRVAEAEGDVPVIARIEGGRVVLDLRTVFPEQEPQLIAALDCLRSH